MKTSLVIFALLGAATAQHDQSGLPACANKCLDGLSTASTIGNCAASAAACICADSSFMSNIACCLARRCTKAEQNTATSYAKSICNSAGVKVADSVQSLCPNP